ILRWFGRAAAAASMFIEGIAAIAAADSSVGTDIAEADAWVRARLEEGRTVTPAGPALDENASAGAAEETGFDQAAASFVAFLVAHAGPAVLREYLAAYDPSRTDQAAVVAYHRPLAVLP